MLRLSWQVLIEHNEAIHRRVHVFLAQGVDLELDDMRAQQ